jgi:hypothetical protein
MQKRPEESGSCGLPLLPIDAFDGEHAVQPVRDVVRVDVEDAELSEALASTV